MLTLRTEELEILSRTLTLRDGNIIIFSGGPGSGKSTVAAAVRREGGSDFVPLPRITYRRARTSDAEEGIRTVTHGSFQQIAVTGAYIYGEPPGIAPSLYPIGEIYAGLKLGKTFVGDGVPDAVSDFRALFGDHVHSIAILTDVQSIEANVRTHLEQEKDVLGTAADKNIDLSILERVSYGSELQAQITGKLTTTYDTIIKNSHHRSKDEFFEEVISNLRMRRIFPLDAGTKRDIYSTL